MQPRSILGHAIKKALNVCVLAPTTFLLSTYATTLQAAPASEVSDYTFITSGNMLAYTEFELSGEPLAESLGLDLDVLDPNTPDQPSIFDYVTGIESYEYSEEAMYALNYQSQLGPHLANGPQNKLRGGTLKALQSRFAELAESVAFPQNEMVKNLYPISLPYRSASPDFASKVDTRIIAEEEIEILDSKGNPVTAKAQIPAYVADYQSLAWNKEQQELVIEPAAIGGILLKEVMWSQDFLGGMHVVKSDEEVEATSSTMDKDGTHALGVSAVDGLQGVILTEISIDKMLYLQNQLGFDGEKLGAKITPNYNPKKNPVWFPHAITVTEKQRQGVNALNALTVTDSSSSLRDTWMLLWPTSEYFAYSDQRQSNSAQNPAFTAVFDGIPFASAPKANIDTEQKNNIAATDAFSLASNLSSMLFKNMDTLHFNDKAYTFVDTYSDGSKSKHVTTYDAAYSIVALSIFQRAQDALPVGYASADSGNLNLKTPQGIRALKMIKSQGDFIISKLKGKNGLVSDGLTLNGKLDKGRSLDAQFAAIRGLTAAFTATGKQRFRDHARQIYQAIDTHYLDSELGTWGINGTAEYTPWTAAAIASAMRETLLHLKNNEKESVPALELATLVERYNDWFRTVINGSSNGEGLQLSEGLADTGEYILKDDRSSDHDNVPHITQAGGKYGRPNVMAAKVILSK